MISSMCFSLAPFSWLPPSLRAFPPVSNTTLGSLLPDVGECVECKVKQVGKGANLEVGQIGHQVDLWS